MNVDVSKDLTELTARAQSKLLRLANDTIVKQGRFTIALSGGSTPQALYTSLAATSVNKSKWHFFFSDERNVPPDDEQSNLRMARETFLDSIPPADRHVDAWGAGAGEPAQIAEDYAQRIYSHFRSEEDSDCDAFTDEIPRFDLVLLGMGIDGHTASLFPNTAALGEERITAANFVPQLNSWRFTMTFPLINNARNIMFLVSGSEKAVTLRNVLQGERQPSELPSQSVEPVDGELEWFIDEAAAEFLGSMII
jgi:6-phosphogluconolactonase